MVYNLRFEEQQDGQRLHSLLLTCIALDINIISHDPAAFKQPTKSKAAPLNEVHSSYPRAPEFQCQPPKRQSSNPRSAKQYRLLPHFAKCIVSHRTQLRFR